MFPLPLVSSSPFQQRKLCMMISFRRLSLSKTLLLFSGVVALPAFSQQPTKTLLVGIDHRTVTSLNGDWHYLVDQPPARGLYTLEGKVRDNGYALNTHPNISSGPRARFLYSSSNPRMGADPRLAGG